MINFFSFIFSFFAFVSLDKTTSVMVNVYLKQKSTIVKVNIYVKKKTKKSEY